MTQDPYANVGPYNDPPQPPAQPSQGQPGPVSGVSPSVAWSTGYPQPQVNPYEGAQHAPDPGYQPATSYPQSPSYPQGAAGSQSASYPQGAGYPQSAGQPQSASYPQSAAYPEGAPVPPQQVPWTTPGALGYVPPVQPPKPARTSPFALLFDFGFTKVATPALGKLLHVGTLVAGALWYVGTVAGFFFSAASGYSLGGAEIGVYPMIVAVLFLLTGWIFPLLATGLVRVFVELATAAIETRDAAKKAPDSES